MSMSNTFSFNATDQATRVTVHGRKHFPKLAVFTEYGLHSPGEFLSNVNTTTPGTATAVLNPSGTSKRGVPCYVQCVAHNTSTCLLAGYETGACILAAATPDRSAIVSSPTTETVATVTAVHTFPPSRMPDRSCWSYLVASGRGNPGASLWRPVRGLSHCSGPYRAAPEPVWHHRKTSSDPGRLGRQRSPT